MVFISYRHRLSKVLACAAKGKREVRVGEAVRLLNVDTGRLVGFKYKLICRFKLVADMVRGGIKEFANDTDGPAFWKES